MTREKTFKLGLSLFYQNLIWLQKSFSPILRQQCFLNNVSSKAHGKHPQANNHDTCLSFLSDFQQHKSTRQLLLWAIFDNLLTIFSALNAACLLGTNRNINQPHLLTKKVVKACGDATIFLGSIITVLGPCYETLSISFRPSYSLESDFRINIVFRISISYSRKQ